MKKILKLGARLSVIDGDDVEIMDALPPAVYSMKFSKMQGFWFEPMQLEPFSGKVYGEQKRMAEKVERRYRAVEGRNLGVLLSGPKGTGKSLFVRNLAAKLSAEMPVVVVKENGGQPMLAELASLKGRAVIIFDEFEKMFRADATGSSGCNTRENDIREQETALSFFDGVETRQEKLLLLTVNETYNLSRLLLGRPGRIHYHFRMALPSVAEIEAYLADNLGAAAVSGDRRDISAKLASRAVSWDSLEAVTAELNSGETVEATLKDLNIGTDEVNGIRIAMRAIYENGAESVTFIDAGDGDDTLETTFAVYATLPDGKRTKIWTRVEAPVAGLRPTGGVGEFEVVGFTQETPEDCDDNPVPGAPAIARVIVQRRSAMEAVNASRYARGDRLSLML
jgi:hypothetical protein